MSSMRLLSKMLNKEPQSDYFLIEWDEVGKPVSILPKKDMVGSTIGVLNGSMVEARFKGKVYRARVIGQG